MMSPQSGGLGSGWILADQPYVAGNAIGSLYSVVFSPTQAYWFDYSGGTFTNPLN